MNSLTIQSVSGVNLEKYFQALAELRIKIFFEYPYLYKGSVEYEKKYLKRYSQSQNAVIVLIHDAEKLIGAATGMPLSEEENFVQAPFLERGLSTADTFYFGESLLKPKYRGKGLGHRFFDEREKWAVEKLKNKKTVFCAVERPDDHPLKPKNYKSLHGFWKKRGYSIIPELIGYFSWQDRTETEESLKPMQFWMKEW